MKQKMKHPTVAELIAFVKGELSFDRSELVRNHIQACKKCTANLKMSKIFDILDKSRSSETSSRISPGCLDETVIADFVIGKKLPKTKRDQIVQHLAQCDSCRVRSVELFREYSNLEIEQQEFIGTPFGVRKISSDNWGANFFAHLQGIFSDIKSVRWAVAVVALFIFATMTFLITQRSNKEGDIWLNPTTLLREADSSSARRFILKKPENGQVLNNNKYINFTWPKIPNIKKYTIQIFAMNGDLIWQFETESASTVFKDTSLLQSGQSYFWQVIAISVKGKPCFSEMRSFVINFP